MGKLPKTDAQALIPAGFERKGIDRSPDADGYVELVVAMRQLQDAIASGRPDFSFSASLAAQVSGMAESLHRFQVEEQDRFFARLWDRSGRGQFLVPAYDWQELGADRRTATVRFGKVYLGSGGAVHGGVIPLVFDEVLGAVAHAGGRSRSRTASLKVDYRAIAPIDTELTITAQLGLVERRKVFVTGELRHGPTLLAEANGLFVTLLPGQP